MSKRFAGRTMPRFSRKWWTDSARTILWVVLVTVLIWAFADMEFTRDRDFTDITVRFSTGKSENLVILSQKEHEFSFKAEGNSSSLDALEQRLREQGSVIQFDVSGYGPGQRFIPAEEILNKALEISKAGLSLVSASPTGFSLRLDQRILVADVPVQFEKTGADLAAPPSISPPEVSIRVARSQWEQIKKTNPRPVLKTQLVNLQRVDTSKPITVDLDPLIDGVRVEPQQQTVSVRVEVQEFTDTRTLTVTIRVVTPATWLEDETWRRYAFVRKDPVEWRRQITVTGPKRDLDQLKAEDVQALVVLNESHKQRVESWLTEEAIIHFPEQLQLRLTGERPKVSFRLEPAPGG